MTWWISLIFELIKLLPEVISWINSHPLASKKEAVMQFKDNVKEALEVRSGIGSPPDILKQG